jgi:hypothetical protein
MQAVTAESTGREWSTMPAGRPRITELLDMGEYTHQLDCKVSIDEPIFEPSPAEIVFTNYRAHQSYSAKLILRNKDKVCCGSIVAGFTRPGCMITCVLCL